MPGLKMRHGDRMHPVDGRSLSPEGQNREAWVKVTDPFCLKVEQRGSKDAPPRATGLVIAKDRSLQFRAKI
jgi:hypothetical protein